MKTNKRKRVRESNDASIDFPTRCMHRLYTCSTTLNCALEKSCIPCAYKIGNFDIALDEKFSKVIPNTRPELCPRSFQKMKPDYIINARSYGYGVAYVRGMNILCVGDGDFTFSLALARLIRGSQHNEDGDKQCNQLVASSYESLSTLQQVYPKIDDTILELKSLGVQVCFRVDATNLNETLPSTLRDVKFHRIVWNFPCTAIANGQDGQNQQMLENKKLVTNFVMNATSEWLDEGVGEIHMIHKTKPPYDQWDLETAALAGWDENVLDDKHKRDEDASNAKLPIEFKGRVVFDKCLLPPYSPRKALDKKSFPCHDACLYVFGWKGRDLSLSGDSFQPSIEGSKVNEEPKNHEIEDGYIIPVDKDLIGRVRDIHFLKRTSIEKRNLVTQGKKKFKNVKKRRTLKVLSKGK